MCIKTRKEFVVCEQLSAIKKQKDNLEWKVVWIFEITNQIENNFTETINFMFNQTTVEFPNTPSYKLRIYILNYSSYTINHVALHISFT